MKKMLCTLSTVVITLLSLSAFAQQKVEYTSNWGKAGFTLETQNTDGVQVNFSVPEFTLEDITIHGKTMKNIGLPGVFLFNNAGAPNIPGTGRYISIPQGATAVMEITDVRTEIIHNIDIAQAPRIPKETEDGLEYPYDEEIYNTNAWYPAQAVQISAPTKVRGVDVVMLGISPFQYNPVTKDLLVYKDIKVKIRFVGGNGHVGDDRLRSRWFDPLLEDMLLNPKALPVVNYNKTTANTEDVGFEYLIIVPNDAFFSQWADSIKQFRTRQGIITGIKTLADIGGNSTTAIENYINNAYNTWSIPPVACLLIGDYGTNATNTINSPIWDAYCASDNIYGDIDANSMPDVVMARMTAQDEAQLQVMVRKFIDYERTPPTSPSFYNHPITALGWQTERWFQICSEAIGGFWKNSLGKNPVRVNAVYGGDPSVDPWSTATNTSTVVNYFGPGGLGYIPATPQGLSGWTGGTPDDVNTAINEGSFMLQHRDHGFEDGWGEPAYTSTYINSLTNTDLTYIMSVNCLTGKFNYSAEVFAEKFHRYTYNNQPSGALGVLAATEVSYSFVNDAFVWGAYDNMWPDFMPAYGCTPVARGVLPAFGNAAGKYFLEQSSWPYNTTNKEVTYNLFHHHGDAFLTVYSEVPQALTVVHNPIIFTGVNSFSVTANPGALICLSMNGEILGTGVGTGSPVAIQIPGTQLPPDHIAVVVTLQNYYRYEGDVTVVPPTGPYVIKNSVLLNDNTGNNNGLMEYGENIQLTIGVKNVGVIQANNVSVTIASADPFVTVTGNTSVYGDIAAGNTVDVPNAFSFNVANNIPDNHQVSFTVTATDGTNNWLSYFSLQGHAPVITYLDFSVSDPLGNNNNRIDPGETVTLTVTMKNTGSAGAGNVMGVLSSSDPYITINSASGTYGDVASSTSSTTTYSITASAATPLGHQATFNLLLNADLGVTGSGNFQAVIGQVPIVIIDLDPDLSSGPVMKTTIQGLGIACDYMTSMPSNLSVYTSAFVCLGIYPSEHALTSSEGQSFANFLNAGGRLYVEGGDTWAYDPATTVHSYFKITGSGDGTGDLGNISGQPSTFAAGMNFTYSGANSYIDHIGPTAASTAFTILKNQSPGYGTAVAYDQGTYKTIGASHEFMGITGNNCPSTRTNLMFEYLVFFGMMEEGLNVNFSANTLTACENATVTFADNSIGECPNSWAWQFPGGNPASSTSQNPVVTYATSGAYDVTLIVSNGTITDTLTKTSYIQVLSTPVQAATPSGPASVCNNTPFSAFSTNPISGVSYYNWSVNPASAGSASGTASTVNINWSGTYSGIASVSVKAGNSCGLGPDSQGFEIELKAAPVVSQQDFANVCTYWGAVWLTGGAPSGGTYTGAGVNLGWFSPGQVSLGNNDVTYTYLDVNGCSASVTKGIFVDPCSGIYEPGSHKLTMELYPNPVNGVFNLVLSGVTEGNSQLTILNVLGEKIIDQDYTAVNGEIHLQLNAANWARGLYFVSFKSGTNILSRKFVVD